MPAIVTRGRGQIQTVTTLGSATGASTVTSKAVTITGNVAIGEIMFAVIGFTASASPTIAFSDSGSNTWTTDLDKWVSGGAAFAIGRMVCTVALTSGTSTVTATETGSSMLTTLLAVFKVSPSQFVTPFSIAGSNSASGASTNPTPGSVTPTSSPTFGVFVSAETSNTSGAPTGSWVEIFDFSNTINLTMQINVLVKDNSVAINNNETVVSTSWAAGQIFYVNTIQGNSPVNVSQAVTTAATR